QVRKRLGAFKDDAAYRYAWEERQRDKAAILHALMREGLLPRDITEDLTTAPTMTADLCQAIHIYLARASSCIVLANLAEGLGKLSQPNLRGPADSTPNGPRKFTVPVEELISDKRFQQLGSVLCSPRQLG